MKRILPVALIALLSLSSCSKSTDPAGPTPPETAELYFPPVGSTEWQTTSPEALGWNKSKIPALTDYLQQEDTRAFIVLKDGRIVLEQYYGQNIQGTGAFGPTSPWQWASAGKTLTGFMVGKAQQEGYLNINEQTGKYLGTGWTATTATQESQITIRHQLTMTTGLNDLAGDPTNTSPAALVYKAAAGTRWAYHNAPYTLLQEVTAKATAKPFDDYFEAKLKNPIGMDGRWALVGNDHIYFSTARSMARFGILIQNNGAWDGTEILNDPAYLQAAVNTSQDINSSYGYLWWLNGKTSFMVPQSQIVFPGPLTTNAPADLVAALGKDGQVLNIVPSKGIVVVRMGSSDNGGLVSMELQDEIWKRLKEVIN